MAGSVRNETNLMGKPALDKAAMDKMRAKLVSSPRPAGSQPSAPPRPIALRAQRARRSRRGWIAILLSAAFLWGLNVVCHTESDAILEFLGFATPVHLAAPKAVLSHKDKVLFWAYAAYDQKKLAATYKLGPRDIINRQDAEIHLRLLMDQGVSPELKAQIDNLRAVAQRRAAAK